VPRSNHPVILKLSPDVDYLDNARRAAKSGVSALTAINTVKALRLDPRTGEPLLANRFGGLSGRAIKPIGLRVVAELRDAGVTLPIIATGGHPDRRRLPGVLLGRCRRGEPRQRQLARFLPWLRAHAVVRCPGASGAACR